MKSERSLFPIYIYGNREQNFDNRCKYTPKTIQNEHVWREQGYTRLKNRY